MALTYSEEITLGTAAPRFVPEGLLGTDELRHHLSDFRYAQALVIAFICNHCPYVKAIQNRLNDLALEYKDRRVQVVGINSNDSTVAPEDSFESMKRQAAEQGFVFPYLWDETQAVAKAYGAVCTPDFFVFKPGDSEDFREADLESQSEHEKRAFYLHYHGRLDDDWKYESRVKRRDLAMAIEDILANRQYSEKQMPSMGCSIKWRPEKRI